MSGWALISALWLGILTSISPCPLASNIAAISFIGRQISAPRRVLWAGAAYTLGRTVAYVVLGMVLLGTLSLFASASDDVSRFLQHYLNRFLGPILILVGLLLLDWLPFSFSFNLAGDKAREKILQKGDFWGAAGLGFLFALSFCPVSAGLFFGGLLSLAAQNNAPILLPLLFGVGTALPVVVFAVMVAFAGQYVGRTFNRLTQIEKWVRVATGAVFILAGIYYILTYVFGLTLLPTA